MARIVDLTGKKFGKLNVIKMDENRASNGSVRWVCECDCGNMAIIVGSKLTGHKTKSCGCMVKGHKDLVGKIYGKLKVIKYMGIKYNSGKAVKTWLCECTCGKKTIVSSGSLGSRNTSSCGCGAIENRRKLSYKKTHGGTNERLHNIWSNIKTSISNKKHKYYKYVGDRGITMYPAWVDSYEIFRDWMYKHGYKDGAMITRLDKNGNFEPGNIDILKREKKKGKKAMEEVAG